MIKSIIIAYVCACSAGCILLSNKTVPKWYTLL